MKTFTLIALLIATIAQAAVNQVPLTNGVVQDQDMHTMEGWSWKDCGEDTDAVHVEDIQVSPDPPQRGQNLTVTAVGTVKREITDGATAKVTVKLGYIKLLTKRFDICEEATKADMEISCPVEEGRYTIVQTAELPKEIPPGKFKVLVEGSTSADEDGDMLCLELVVDFMKPIGKIW